jgi:hypothetical protein
VRQRAGVASKQVLVDTGKCTCSAKRPQACSAVGCMRQGRRARPPRTAAPTAQVRRRVPPARHPPHTWHLDWQARVKPCFPHSGEKRLPLAPPAIIKVLCVSRTRTPRRWRIRGVSRRGQRQQQVQLLRKYRRLGRQTWVRVLPSWAFRSQGPADHPTRKGAQKPARTNQQCKKADARHPLPPPPRLTTTHHFGE